MTTIILYTFADKELYARYDCSHDSIAFYRRAHRVDDNTFPRVDNVVTAGSGSATTLFIYVLTSEKNFAI